MSDELVAKLRAKANRTENPHEAHAFHAKADAIEQKNRIAGPQFATTNPRVSSGTGTWRASKYASDDPIDRATRNQGSSTSSTWRNDDAINKAKAAHDARMKRSQEAHEARMARSKAAHEARMARMKKWGLK